MNFQLLAGVMLVVGAAISLTGKKRLKIALIPFGLMVVFFILSIVSSAV